MKKRVLAILTVLSVLFALTACGAQAVKPDYTEKTAETALNAGKDLEGKTVQLTVDKLAPNSMFGYNMQTGKHLNFVSSSNPKVKAGDKVTVKVTKVQSMMGSFIITYSDLKK
ncbi:hypothetical protein [Lacticaseibacillus mingshuiensis]|uniref:TRAM domain-containing protein n=2 Tax=Lacticaseibacillus mingshuiensis TaxID=2799574 RepID=A0ABW4CHV7_9LACO|nr:hypothetical protein [Lacticaseibacillus mingshuiensis]